MQVEGKIKIIGEELTFGANGFIKRELIVVTQEQYPQTLKIDFVQDKCDLPNSYQVGQDVKININLRGREWVNPEGVTKYITDLRGWAIQVMNNNPAGNGGDAETPPFPTQEAGTTPDVSKTEGETEDDLPF